jgi:hypothetical protein
MSKKNLRRRRKNFFFFGNFFFFLRERNAVTVSQMSQPLSYDDKPTVAPIPLGEVSLRLARL